MKILIQRSTDTLLLTPHGAWTAEKDQARAFQHCTEAIDFCVDQGLTDVRLWLSFDNAKYDFPMEVFRAETRVLVKYNKELREKGRALLGEMDQEQAKAKERKKLFRFPRPKTEPRP